MPEAARIHIPQWARALVFALLAPSCATAPTPPRSQDPNPIVESAPIAISEPIHCSRTFASLHDSTGTPSDVPACDHSVPDSTDQAIEFTETIRSWPVRGHTLYNLDTTIAPAKTLQDSCKTAEIDQWISPKDGSENESLIGLSLAALGGSIQSGNITTLLANREIRYTAENKSVIRQTLKGYRIQRTPKGIHFQTQTIKCD
jgi:hypothetical protein